MKTGRPEKRALKPQKVFVYRRLQSRHVGSNVNALAGNRVARVVTKRIVIGMRQVQSPDMSVTVESKIRHLDRMRSHIADQRRTHQKSIAVILDAAAIVVEMKTAFDRVTLANKVLAKNVGDVNVLMSRVETIQAAVGVLFEH